MRVTPTQEGRFMATSERSVAVTQENIGPNTPMGANLVGTGATFRTWAPGAREVYICYDRNWGPKDANMLLTKDSQGYWTGFVPGITDGTQYKFYVVGAGSEGYKRDPYARELTIDPPFPRSNCIVCATDRYPWHDRGFRPPAFNDLTIYQFHVGTYYIPATRPRTSANFLDVLNKLDYLLALGVNAVELLPVVEFPTQFSLGYNGTDLFSPEMDYATDNPAELAEYRDTINALLRRRGLPEITIDNIRWSMNQLKAFTDLCHVYGLAVILDVVYNHAGGGFDDNSIYFFDRAPNGNNNNSLYFTDQGLAGGLVFAFWKQEVRQFLIDNARFFLQEHHVDGFRYDEVSGIVSHSNNGWRFCQDLTRTVRSVKPEAIQIAEYWPSDSFVVKRVDDGGAGFDATWYAGLRDSVRAAISQAASGRERLIDLDSVANSLRRPADFPAIWKVVNYVESHDEVFLGRSPRIAALGDASNARSWYARSRARVANGLVLTSPGIPMLFMGQEFLEDKQWSDDLSVVSDHLIWWGGLQQGDKAMVDHLRFVQDLIGLRRRHPALRGEQVNVFHVHNQNRIIAFHRWLEGSGRDVVVVASLSEFTFYNYNLGFPRSGQWFEAFNSDVYDNWVNPQKVGNGGSIFAGGSPLHALPSSAPIVIPANSILVFTSDMGD